jgi:hypothetical protein
MNSKLCFAVVLLLGFGFALCSAPISAAELDSMPLSDAATSDDEAKLAAKYAPIAELKRERQPCPNGEVGEPFLPAPVDIVLGDPDVVLRRDTGAAHTADDPIVLP